MDSIMNQSQGQMRKLPLLQAGSWMVNSGLLFSRSYLMMRQMN